MPYSELIKRFDRIRDYMRSFYVYGFKSREDYGASRSYDNERRRVESWLGDFMSFRQDPSGKAVFLSVDSRRIPQNPLYKAFRAKSFTDGDITLHFCLLDLLARGEALSARELSDRICLLCPAGSGGPFSPDESTVRKKLKEYESLGLLIPERRGREVLYRRSDDPALSLDAWAQALAFFSEAAPLGVVGSYLTDRLTEPCSLFRFKHHYILHALDSEILLQLLEGIRQRRALTAHVRSLRGGPDYRRTLCPLKIYASTQSGRQYLLGWFYQGRQMVFLRLDAIRRVTLGNPEPKYEQYLGFWEKFDQNLWGVSAGPGHSMDHVEMTLRMGPGEDFILQRLEREKRHGHVERLDAHTCRFTADVYDAAEMLPWLRTFLGRITELTCSNRAVQDLFLEDLGRMEALYGLREEEDHAVQ